MIDDKELIRRALLGDQQAQQACTDKGIALTCPFCQGEAILEYDVAAPFEYDVVCGDCGIMKGISEDKNVAIREWNTRSAPPVGRCKDCRWYEYGKAWYPYCNHPDGLANSVKTTDFCSYFEPKED